MYQNKVMYSVPLDAIVSKLDGFQQQCVMLKCNQTQVLTSRVSPASRQQLQGNMKQTGKLPKA